MLVSRNGLSKHLKVSVDLCSIPKTVIFCARKDTVVCVFEYLQHVASAESMLECTTQA